MPILATTLWRLSPRTTNGNSSGLLVKRPIRANRSAFCVKGQYRHTISTERVALKQLLRCGLQGNWIRGGQLNVLGIRLSLTFINAVFVY